MAKTKKQRVPAPKYRIGDAVVYKDRYEKDMGIYHQSVIIRCVGYLEETDPNDSVGWFYATAETEATQSDNLDEDDILFIVE